MEHPAAVAFLMACWVVGLAFGFFMRGGKLTRGRQKKYLAMLVIWVFIFISWLIFMLNDWLFAADYSKATFDFMWVLTAVFVIGYCTERM